MPDLVPMLAGVLVFLVIGLVWSLTTARRRETELRQDLNLAEDQARTVEEHNRALEGERETLKKALGKTENSLKELEGRHSRLEQARDELERRKTSLEKVRSELEENVAGLEADRTVLKKKLDSLAYEKENLETRVAGFQGEWKRQLTTVEDEVATVLRQITEFKSGTRLPLEDESK